MQTPYLPLAGLRGLILGVANEHSIAWGCAREAHRQGARLALSYLNDKARSYVAPLAEQIDAPIFPCDVTVPGSLESFVEQGVASLGGLDFAVHAIAWAPAADLHGRVTDSSREGFGQAMAISGHTFAELGRLCEPHMGHGGALITMTYHGANVAIPHYGLMGPVKAALEGMVRYMALELGPKGIRVHAVSPGPIMTRAASGIAHFDELLATAQQRAPLQRLVTQEEVGALTAFLVGPGGSGMTGQTLFVDGGMHAVG
ncbi:enoyl-ACP reductase FabI [Thiohalocapsa sp. ML1]|jgi:enoyl-[acyl-carrier protein] reductase I|uniref:enoyl-ACP reductase FabI n=1 Tax=Thiohalocapsa sp. ML1 TaxID=1431688 RepID=UPI000731F663|nr:enoyl-ACP reductase FabI [Thiohalocapsa sp. ML1]